MLEPRGSPGFDPVLEQNASTENRENGHHEKRPTFCKSLEQGVGPVTTTQ